MREKSVQKTAEKASLFGSKLSLAFVILLDSSA